MSVAYEYSPMSIDTPFGEGWGGLHTVHTCTGAQPQTCLHTTPCASASLVAARPPRCVGHVLRWGVPAIRTWRPSCMPQQTMAMACVYTLGALVECEGQTLPAST